MTAPRNEHERALFALNMGRAAGLLSKLAKDDPEAKGAGQAVLDAWNLLQARRDTGHQLTERKTSELLASERKPKLTGYVLQYEDGERAIIELSAVRWLSNEKMWALMHSEPKAPIDWGAVDEELLALVRDKTLGTEPGFVDEMRALLRKVSGQ